MSTTPKTDAAAFTMGIMGTPPGEAPKDYVSGALCRQFERQNAELLEALKVALAVMKLQRDVIERGAHKGAWAHPIAMAEAAISKAKE